MTSSALVTGGAGYLGARVVARLAGAGWKVVVADRVPPGDAKLDSAIVDVRDPAAVVAALRDRHWDAVVHLAGSVSRSREGLPDGYSTISDHLRATASVLAAIPEGWQGRLVHASSMTVYGCPTAVPVCEDAQMAPVDAYGCAKAITDELVRTWAATGGFDAWTLRFGGLFSEDRLGGALRAFTLAALRGSPAVVSAEHPTPWDVLHVDDAAEAVVRVLDARERGPIAVNIAYGESVDLVSLAERIVRRAESDSEVRVEGPAHHPAFAMDISRARMLLGWPPHTLDERLDTFRDALAREAGQE